MFCEGNELDSILSVLYLQRLRLFVPLDAGYKSVTFSTFADVFVLKLKKIRFLIMQVFNGVVNLMEHIQ
jgi:hypothetical protein